MSSGSLLLIGLAGVTVVAIGLSSYGVKRWSDTTRDLLVQLERGRTAPPVPRYLSAELVGLPPPVQRYFQTVLSDGQPIITAVSVTHIGTFNMGEVADQWKSFTSQQRVVTRRPGFVWNGRIQMLPGVPVVVHDAYIRGEGRLHPAILGLFSLMDMRGTGDIAQGELMRFFAEAAWYPTALLPSQGVQWTPVDDHTARAVLTDGNLQLSMTFGFDAQNLITFVRAEARGRTVGDAIVMTPWEGRWSDYQRRDGMLVPMKGDVSWLTEQGRKTYWRGTIREITYEFASVE